MIKKKRKKEQTFHGSSGDLIDYEISVTWTFCGVRFYGYEDVQISTESENNKTVGYK